MTKKNLIRLYLAFLISCIYSLKGHLCFFLQHSSGRCVRSSAKPFFSSATLKIWYLELTNRCTEPEAQFRFLDDGVLNHVSSTGCVLPFDGRPFPADDTKLAVFDGYNVCTNKSGHAYTQTTHGSLRHASGKCIQPHTSFQTVPLRAKLEYTLVCNSTNQQFIMGSVTCKGNRTSNVNCPSSEVIVITSANYGGLARLQTCGYYSNYNCMLPATRCHVKRRCDGQQSCKIDVETSEFKRDPCPEMPKYLHLEYKCVKKTEFETENINITDVRLALQTSPGNGLVEILESSKPDAWQGLCVDSWKTTEQQVICRSLGYSGAKEIQSPSTAGHNIAGDDHVIYGDLYCDVKDNNISSCCFQKSDAKEKTCTAMARVACTMCSEPLLIGRNPGITFTASNSLPDHTADQAAISSDRSWCGIGPGDYLEVDLGQTYVISQLSMLGNRSRGHWVTSYELLYSENKGNWVQVTAGEQKLFAGNLDGEKLSSVGLESNITAKRLKVLPNAWNGLPCLRLEICGHRLLPDAPENFTLSRISAFAAEVTWSKPKETGDKPFTDYRIRLYSEGNLYLNFVTKEDHWSVATLRPYKLYTIVLQAGNKHGYGLKTEITFRTNSTTPSGPPTNITIVAGTSASLNISWNQPLPFHRNGILTGYEACIAHVHSREECDHIIRTKSNTIRVGNLGAAMQYKVKISARTDAGFGNYSAEYFKITNAAAPTCNQSTITEQSFVVRFQRPRGDVRFCQVIVTTLPAEDTLPQVSLYSREPLTYLEASDFSSSTPYIAAEFTTEEFDSFKEFTIGDGKILAALEEMPRKHQAVKKLLNGPLSSNTRYTVFQKFYSDKELLCSSDFLPPVRTTGEGSYEKLKAASGNSGDNFKVPFLIVTVLLGLVLFAIICLLLFKRRQGKSKNIAEPATPAEKIPMKRTKNNNDQQIPDSV